MGTVSGILDTFRGGSAHAVRTAVAVALLLAVSLMVPGAAAAGQPSPDEVEILASFGDRPPVTMQARTAPMLPCDTYCLASCAQDACPSGGSALVSETIDLPHVASEVVSSTLPMRVAGGAPFKLLRPPRG